MTAEDEEMLELSARVATAASCVTIGLLNGMSPNRIEKVAKIELAKSGRETELTTALLDKILEIATAQVKSFTSGAKRG